MLSSGQLSIFEKLIYMGICIDSEGFIVLGGKGLIEGILNGKYKVKSGSIVNIWGGFSTKYKNVV